MNCTYCEVPINRHWFHITITTNRETVITDEKICQACGIRVNILLAEFKFNNPRRTFINSQAAKP